MWELASSDAGSVGRYFRAPMNKDGCPAQGTARYLASLRDGGPVQSGFQREFPRGLNFDVLHLDQPHESAHTRARAREKEIRGEKRKTQALA